MIGTVQGGPFARKDKGRSIKWESQKVWTISETTVDLDQEREDFLNPGKNKKIVPKNLTPGEKVKRSL